VPTKSLRVPLSESLQDYLEVVYVLVRSRRVARMKEIADRLGVGKSSATGAVRALAARGLVNYGPYQFVTLTERGEEVGRRLVRRHEILKRFMMEILGVPEVEAETVGCKMEHAIQGDVLDRFVRFLEFVERRGRIDVSWAAAFRAFKDGHARRPWRCRVTRRGL